jgi:hypothetical protein
VPTTGFRVTPPRLLRPVGVDAGYSAFPAACQYPDGTVRLVWREGSDHVDARDGVIRSATSTDDGASWTAATTLLPAEPGTVDLRDPCLSHTDGVSHLTYFTATPADPGAGCFVRAGTDGGARWGPAARIDRGLVSACVSAPLVPFGSGLAAVFYGKARGERHDSCWWATSPDGAEWSAPIRLADGRAAGFDFQEPWAVVRGGAVRVFFRWGNWHAIGSVHLRGNAFSEPAIAFGHGTARPGAAWLRDGTLLVSYRHTRNRAAHLRASRDGGRTWSRPVRQTRTVPGTLGMTYSQPLELFSGRVFCPIATELSPARSVLLAGCAQDARTVGPR